MLRTIFVLVLMSVGVVSSLYGAFYSLLFYFWLAYFRPEQWVWIDFISSLNLSYLVGLYTVVIACFSKERWPVNARVLVLGLFVAQTLLSTIFSPHPGYAWMQWIEFFKFAVITYLIVVLVNDPRRFRLALLIAALSLAFESAKQGWAGLVLHPGGVNTNTLPMLGDNNGIAVGMAMLVPILTALGATAPRRLERAMHYFLALGVLYRGIATYSRGGFLAFGALAAVYLLRSRRRLAAVTAVVLAALIIFPALPDAFWERMDTIRPPSEVSESDESALGRLHFWSIALDMANSRPLLGVGHNAYSQSYDEYDDSDGAFGHYRAVHSTWFGLLAELGYPGLLLFIVLIGLALRTCARARAAARAAPANAPLRHFAFAVEGALVAFIVGGSFVTVQYTEMLWHLIGFSISLDAIALAALAAAEAPATSDAAVAPALRAEATA